MADPATNTPACAEGTPPKGAPSTGTVTGLGGGGESAPPKKRVRKKKQTEEPSE